MSGPHDAPQPAPGVNNTILNPSSVVGSVEKNEEPSAVGLQLEQQQGNTNPKSNSSSRQESIDLTKRKIEARFHLPKYKKVQGLIFVVSVSDADGTDVDGANMKATFEKLKFAVYDVLDCTAEEIVCLIKAAAIIEYPKLYRFVAFYFAGHGGWDTQREELFIVGFQKSNSDHEILHINEYIIDPLECLQKKGISRLFFFDCCQTEGSGTAFRDFRPITRSHSGQLIAFAANIGQKSWGDQKKGGIWTYHFCKNLRESNDDIVAILARTRDNVTEWRKSLQEPYFKSNLGETKLNKVGNNTSGTTIHRSSSALPIHMAVLLPGPPEEKEIELLAKRISESKCRGIKYICEVIKTDASRIPQDKPLEEQIKIALNIWIANNPGNDRNQLRKLLAEGRLSTFCNCLATDK